MNTLLSFLMHQEVLGEPQVPPGPSWSIGAWTAGTGTILSVAGGFARATRSGGTPRISRQVTGLTPSATYRVQSNVYKRTSNGSLYFRVATTQNLTTADILGLGPSATDLVVDSTFVAPAGGECYIGIVHTATTDGQYAETDEDFILTEI